MTVCIDTNVLLQLFGKSRPYGQITDALQQGRLELAVSNEVLLEYEETLTQLSGQGRWQAVETFLHGVSRLHDSALRPTSFSVSRDHWGPGRQQVCGLRHRR